MSNTTAPATPAPGNDYDIWSDLTAKLNFSSSVLSTVTTLAVIVFMAVYPGARDNVNYTRTVLLFSLFIADFINASTTGVAEYLSLHGNLKPQTTFCDVQGFLGQWSIQASDLSTFALAVTTFIISRSALDLRTLSIRLRQLDKATLYILAAIWTIPFITALIGYKIVGMGIAGGWCWFANIKEEKTKSTLVRYITSHGPRMFIIFAMLVMYIDIFLRLRYKLKVQESKIASMGGSSNGTGSFNSDRYHRPPTNAWANTSAPPSTAVSAWSMEADKASTEMRARLDAQKAAIQKLLIYPTIYAVLWIPGILNRIFEATNQSQSTIKITVFFMFTIQLIGFANAVTYGFSRFFGKTNT
ncbi:hypothetical protein HDU97_005731 [Phlyctochytrium planicorne]|nr:hypothetical protein HDU97_005731 [Phlyctochytrium planicorne]